MDRFVRVWAGFRAGRVRPLDHLPAQPVALAPRCRAVPRSPAPAPRDRAAYTINRLGTWFGVIALSLAVFDHTHSALAVAALLIAAQALPAFIVPAVVARVEASKRRSELSGAVRVRGRRDRARSRCCSWHFWLPGDPAAGRGRRHRRARRQRAAAHRGRPRVASARSSPRRPTEPHEAEQQRERGAQRRLLGHVRARPGARRPGRRRGRRRRRRCFVDVGSFVICGALLLDLQPPRRARRRANRYARG